MPKIILNLIPVSKPGVENSNRFQVEIIQEEIYLTADQAISLLVNTANSIVEYKEMVNNETNTLQLEQSSPLSITNKNKKRINDNSKPNTLDQGNNGSL